MNQPDLLTRLANWLRGLFAQPSTPLQPVEEVNSSAPDGPVTRKVSLIIYNPVLLTQRGRRLTEVLGWNDPDRLTAALIDDLRTVSHGYVQYQIAERILVDAFPDKADGFAYTGEEYLHCIRNGSGFHQPDDVDYYRILADFDLPEKVKNGSIDEVWTVGFPYAGFYESRMAGPKAFWCNAPALDGTPESGRRYVIMAFNYQRGVGEMLESYSHRVESIMEQVYRKLPPTDNRNYWKRYIRHEKTNPGKSEVGTVHFAPNSVTDYDWGNSNPVLSGCQNWPNFPDLSGAPLTVNCAEWGNGEIRAHHRWWLDHLPHVSGSSAGIHLNWWEYIADPNRVG